MNFKGCKKEYPVGMIMGNFILNYNFPITKEELKNRLRGKFFYPEFFYFYNKETKKFHRADFYIKMLKGILPSMVLISVRFHLMKWEFII